MVAQNHNQRSNIPCLNIAPQNASKSYPAKYRCPVNGKEYGTVTVKTLLLHIKYPREANLADQGYYFCTDPACEVVYFGRDNTVVARSGGRTPTWQKRPQPHSTVCYCFGVSLQQTAVSEIRDFVTQKTNPFARAEPPIPPAVVV